MVDNTGHDSISSEEHPLQEEHDWSAFNSESSDDEEVELFADWNENNTDNNDEANSEEFLNYERVNLESHQLIWCEEEHGYSENRVSILQLQKIVDYTKLIDDVKKCRQFLKRTSDVDTFLVCSCMFGNRLIPHIHKLKNVRVIYVFCLNKRIHKKWNHGYTKVKQMGSADLSFLLSDLTKEVQEYLKQTKDNIFNETGRDNKTVDSGCSEWWQNFVDSVCHLPYTDQCRRRLVTILENHYQNNQQTLETLKQFDKTYTPETALTWYTRDTFLYRLLNRTLRQHNIQLTFLFAFYMKDIFIQLKKEHENFKNNYSSQLPLEVYRGQRITTSEFANLSETYKKSGNYAIVINSFFSATTKRSSALHLLGAPIQHHEDNEQHILFEIKIDTEITSRPFANITNHSHFTEEDEVLFMRGTAFRVYGISYDDQMNIYIVKLILVHDDKILSVDDLTGMTTKITLKKCLNIMRGLYQANTLEINAIFMELKELFPVEKGWLEAIKLHCIGRMHYVYHRTGNWLYYKQAVDIYEMYLHDTELNCAVDIALIHLDIGYYYQSQESDKLSLANEHYELGIIICEYSLLSMVDKEARVKLYETIVEICKQRNKLNRNNILDSIKYQELYVQEMLNYYPPDNSCVAKCIVDLADTQKSMLLSEKTLENYQKAIQLYMLNSQSKPNDIADIYAKISRMYIKQKQDYDSAAHFKKMEIEHLLKFDTPDPVDSKTEVEMLDHTTRIGETQQELANICIRLRQYSLAYGILIEAEKLYRSISNIYNADNQLNAIEYRIKTVMQKLSEKE